MEDYEIPRPNGYKLLSSFDMIFYCSSLIQIYTDFLRICAGHFFQDLGKDFYFILSVTKN